jgi:hypothetical protein
MVSKVVAGRHEIHFIRCRDRSTYHSHASLSPPAAVSGRPPLTAPF